MVFGKVLFASTKTIFQDAVYKQVDVKNTFFIYLGYIMVYNVPLPGPGG